MKIDYKKYKKIEELFIQNAKADLKYNCAICGKEMKTIHSTHLQKHGLTKETFIEEYGLPNEFYFKRHTLDLIIDKIYSLYITNTDKWLSLNSITAEYTTKEKGGEYFRKFNKGDIRAHLKGDNAIGVFPLKYCSKFLIFDIDSYYSIYDAIEIANSIKHILEGYFNKEEIHITYSGNKGYHIELFFDDYVAIKDLQEVFDIVLNEINIENYEGVNVEIRPESQGKDGKGIKLPLGVNHKNANGNNYCYFVDENFEPIENEIEYLLNIKKSDNSIVKEIIRDYRDRTITSYKNGYMNNKCKLEDDNSILKINENIDSDDIIINKIANNYDSVAIENYLNNGLTEMGTRHNITFLIAIYLKELGHDKDDNEKILLKWSLKQIESGFSKGNINEVIRDIKNILKGVYDSNKNYRLSKFKKNIYITREDLNRIEALNTLGKAQGNTVINHQKVLFAMLIHGKRYSNINGEFYMTYAQMQEATGINSETTICKCINQLNEWGYINIVARNVKGESGIKKAPNIYSLKFDNKNDENLYKICSNKKLCENCFYNMINKVYCKETIDKVVTRRIKSKVLSISNSCSMNI